MEGYVTTGVSLGSFGGYVVLDFGASQRMPAAYVTGGIYNDPANAYGVDFTLYGNAMGTWAEPGCVQVSQDGVNWYDIAGSLHYQMPRNTAGGAIWDYTVTYENPVAADDDLAERRRLARRKRRHMVCQLQDPADQFRNTGKRPCGLSTTGTGTTISRCSTTTLSLRPAHTALDGLRQPSPAARAARQIWLPTRRRTAALLRS